MNLELERKIQSHEVEIGVLKHSFDRVVLSIDENTKSNHELIKTLAVYTTKHDGLESKMSELQVAQTNIISVQLVHGENIAAMKPVVDNLRGFVWKVASTVLIGGSGIAAIIVAASKFTGE